MARPAGNLRRALCALAAVALLRRSSAVENPEDFVNPLCGTFTDGQRFSTGNTLPLVARPWGFNHYSAQTNEGRSAWWFGGNAHEFKWLRLTHQPSPWIGDWGWLNFGPMMGPATANPTMFWEPRGAHYKPYEFDATLAPDNMRVRFTPTDHGGVLKVTFPAHNPGSHEKHVCFRHPANQGAGSAAWGAERSSQDALSFALTAKKKPNGTPNNFGLRVVADLRTRGLRKASAAKISAHGTEMKCFSLDKEETDVTVVFAASLLSEEQARRTLELEVGRRSYEAVVEESRSVWREMLNRVEVVDAGPLREATFRRLSIFYTGLYRALLFPRRLDEPLLGDPSARVHWSPYDPEGRTFPGPLVTDNGFWDTFRSVYTLLILAYPAEATDILRGWLAAFEEGTWLPQWSSPGYRDSMVGTFSDNVVADGLLKGLDLDPGLAWRALERDAFTPGQGSRGKVGYQYYDSGGYLPYDVGVSDTVSRTLDFALADYAAAAAARRLGKAEASEKLFRRAIGARDALFDAKTGLFRPKSSGGAFKPAFDAAAWGHGYVEGSAWQHSFPPFDLQGLARLHGGRDRLSEKVLRLLETPGYFRTGGYGQQIHEMTEMRALAMGQLGHSNQPSHHILHLLLALDGGAAPCRSRAAAAAAAAAEEETFSEALRGGGGAVCARRLGERAIREVLERAYGPEHYAGDEDNGEMGAWYVLSALGLFDPAPGTDFGYVLGSPLFREVRLSGAGGLRLLSRRAGGAAYHVRDVLLGGESVARYAEDGDGYEGLGWRVSHEQIRRGGTLRFLIGDEQAEGADGAAGDGGRGGGGANVPQDGANLPQNGADLPQNGANSPQKSADLPQNGAKLPQNGAKLPQNGAKVPQSSGSAPQRGAGPPVARREEVRMRGASGGGASHSAMPERGEHAQPSFEAGFAAGTLVMCVLGVASKIYAETRGKRRKAAPSASGRREMHVV